MRKILLCLGVVLLALTGLTARAQMIYGNGKLTASGQYWDGSWQPKNVSIDVSASFNGNFNSLSIMGLSEMVPNYTGGMNLKIDSEGNITSGTTTTAYSGADYSGLTENPSGKISISGKIVNTGTNESTLTLSGWGDLAQSGGTWFFNYGKWDSTEVVFDFAIPIIPAYEEPEPEPEPVVKSGDGTWSATLSHWDEGDIPISGQTVKGNFNGNQLTVSGIRTNDALNTAGNEYFEPLTLTVDLETGEARGESQLAFVYPGYAAYNGYYCDNDKISGKPWIITGKYVNTGDGKSKLTLSEWCTKYDNTAGRGGPGTWKDSQVIFEFEIEGLYTEEPQEPEPEPVVKSGDGTWSATLSHWDEGDIPISGQTVKGNFNGNQLTVSGIRTNDALNTAGNEYFEPLTLTVDLETGEARGESQLAFVYPGYAAYNGYYCDNDKISGKPWIITGKYVNTGDGKSKLTLSEWCTKYDNTAGRGGPGTWKDSQVIFDFEIEGLYTEEIQEPEPEPITGTAKFTSVIVDWDGNSVPWSGNGAKLNGEYLDGTFTVSNIPILYKQQSANNSIMMPLALEVNLTTGDVVGSDQQMYSYSGYPDYDAYYCDNDKKDDGRPYIITGKLYNVGDGTTKLILTDFCEKTKTGSGRLGNGLWTEFTAIFDFEIPELTAVEPEPEPEFNGKMTYTFNDWSEDIPGLTNDVNGSYEDGILTIEGIIPAVIKSDTNPLNLTVNKETGELEGLEQRAYIASDSYYGDDLPVYYADFAQPRSKKITGKVENTEDNKCKVTLSDWCELTYYSTDIQAIGVLADGYFKDTEIIFDFAIPDLATEEPEPEVKVNVMTANYYKPDGDLRTYENVTGEYDADSKTLTLKNVANKSSYPLVFDVDSEGNIVSKPKQLSNYEDGLEMYYSDSNEKNNIVYGKIENGEKTATIKLDDWGDYIPDWGLFYSQWFNTVIVLDHTIELPSADVDPEPEPEPGEIITGIFTGMKSSDNSFQFSDDNPFGIKFILKESRITAYGNYWKLFWIDNSGQNNKVNGLYHYLLPATINPDTKEITLNDMDTYKNHIRYDYPKDFSSTAVYEGLYKAANSSDNGTQMENSCVVIASYHKSGMTDFNRIERAFYLKGGEFKGDTNGVLPGFTVKYGSDYIDFKDDVEYQWELIFEEIPLGEAEESDYVSGTGDFKSLYSQEGGAKDELYTATVNGKFNKGQLKVDRMPTSIPDSRSYCNEITFDVDLETGTATASDQTVYELFNGAAYVPAYFATYPDMGKTVTGDFVNLGNGKCQLTLPDWCEMFSSATVNGIYWAQTKIIFNFEVNGLKVGTEADDPEVSYVPTVNYMTANVGSENGASKLYEPVTGEYNETAKTITLVNVAGKATDCPLTLTVDSEGNLVSIGNQASSHEYDSEGISIIYSDIAKADNKVYGKVENQTDGTCVITLQPWGDYVPEFPDFLPGQSWYNSYIVLNISIPGLPNYKEDNGEGPEPGEQIGLVEGVWQFDIYDIYKSQTSTQTWTATLYDGQLQFTGNATYPDFNAEYYSDGRVVIPNEESFIGVGGSRDYDLYQRPFTNFNAADNSYDKTEVTAQFDSDKDVMTFVTSPRQGILWNAYLSGELAGGFDMLAFVKGTHLSKSETEPSIVINPDEIECNPTEFFADVFIPIHTAGLPMDTKITITYSFNGGASVTKEVETGRNLLSFFGLQPGIKYELTLYAESGEMQTEPITYSFVTAGEDTTGIDSISTDNEDVRYFNLQGIEIFNPTPGTICIKVTGNKAERIMVR